TNYPPNSGLDVWVDVWFGTDPGSLTQVVDAATDGPHVSSVNVNAPGADEYFWRIDSYLDGNNTTLSKTGEVFRFVVVDSDGDGFPDDYEIEHSGTATGLNPGDDLDSDGLNNLEEFNNYTDPNDGDSDDDGLNDGPEVNGTAGARPATDPLDADSDNDGLSDLDESNTGTWISSSDTGTNPMDRDQDDDGLLDGEETNTGVYVNPGNTGTDPFDADSDSDGAGDWYEVAGSLTDPNHAVDVPVVPYPLPDPDGLPGATGVPVKVYIMIGERNMVGHGLRDGGKGSLSNITGTDKKFPHLLDAAEDWTVRNDVRYRGLMSAIGNEWLSEGNGAAGDRFGPELGFGHVLGYHHNEPVVIVKVSRSSSSLAYEFLSPGSTRYDFDGLTFAGYGDGEESWTQGEVPDPPGPSDPYAGEEYDNLINEVQTVLTNFDSEFPMHAGEGYEIAGIALWQGYEDSLTPGHAEAFETHLADLVTNLKTDLGVPDVPVAIAGIGFNGGPYNPMSEYGRIYNGQLTVGDAITYPNFFGTVGSVDVRPYWRNASVSPLDSDSFYNQNAETFMLVGDALARRLIELQSVTGELVAESPEDDSTDAFANLTLYAVFAEGQVVGSGNITLRNLTDLVDIVIPIADPRVTLTDNLLSIDGNGLIDWNKSYAVQMDAGVVETLVGNV
ncbi:MAG: sialate O-acetylesterase, partial [Verrucomicrobiota bacterium]